MTSCPDCPHLIPYARMPRPRALCCMDRTPEVRITRKGVKIQNLAEAQRGPTPNRAQRRAAAHRKKTSQAAQKRDR